MSHYRKPSPWRLTMLHGIMWFACLIATFPIFRIVAISVRDTGTVASGEQMSFPPRGEATATDYLHFFADAIIPYEIFTALRQTEPQETTPDKNQQRPPKTHSQSPEPTAELWNEFEKLDAAETQQDKPHFWYSNYLTLFTQHRFFQWVYNSLIIAFSASFIGVSLAATAAYAFARFEFPGKPLATGLLFTTQMIPAPMMIVPVYLVIKNLNLGNTYAGLVLAMTVTSLPFCIMVLKGYFETIPKSLEEAARVDGCNPVTAFFRILLPLAKPALAIAFLFSFLTAWSEFLLASTLIDDAELRPWTLGLMSFSGNFDARWGLFAAGSVVIAIPSMLLFLYSSKYVISGLTVGSVKG